MAGLIYLDGRSRDSIELPRAIALRASETVQAIAQETVPELERLHSLAWQVGSPALVHGLARLISRLEKADREMHAFAGIATAADTADPDHIAKPGHGAAA